MSEDSKQHPQMRGKHGMCVFLWLGFLGVMVSGFVRVHVNFVIFIFLNS